MISAAESNVFGLSREELDAWEARNDREQQINEQEKENENEQGVSTRLDFTNDQIDKQTLWRWLLPVVLWYIPTRVY